MIQEVWTSGDVSVGPRVEAKVYPITTPSGRVVLPPDGYCWRLTEERFKEYVDDNRIWFGQDGNNVPRIKRFLSEVKSTVVSTTWWSRDEVGDNQEAKREIKSLFGNDVFDTPKPEKLIQRILTIASNEGDLILDSFLGSGTTTAVAHKMNRKWIGIEMGDHAYTHCKKRMDLVISGEQGGISNSVNWSGGGGYSFLQLAPTLIKHDSFGQQIINPEYNPEMLAAAVAIHEGYSYDPHKDVYWKQSTNNNGSYLYVTTRHIDNSFIENIKT